MTKRAICLCHKTSVCKRLSHKAQQLQGTTLSLLVLYHLSAQRSWALSDYSRFDLVPEYVHRDR